MYSKARVTHFIGTLGVFLCLTYGHPSAVNAQPAVCSKIFATDLNADDNAGAQFLLKRKTPDHTAPQVERSAEVYKAETGKTLNKPVEKIQAWLQRYDSWLKKIQTDDRAQELFTNSINREFVIKKESIPESYFELQKKIYAETGRGVLEINDQNREYLSNVVVADQKSSLKIWIDHLFFSAETASYPMWSRVWAFQGLTKLGKYDFENGAYGNRDKSMTAPFPSLEKVALKQTVEAMIAKVNGRPLDQITDPATLALLDNANFGKIFGRSVFIEINRKLETLSIDGKWVRYPRGSNPKPLVDSIACKNTGWCTAQPATAAQQLNNGDFHIYYSMNEQGQPTEPRIAILLRGDQIDQVRGIAEKQNLDDKITKTDILDKKLAEFGIEGERYQKRNSDMKTLSLIEQKHLKQLPLSKEEILFLYEITGQIEGFGHEKDPRIEVIRAARNVKHDLAQALNIKEEQISTTEEELLSGHMLVHFGDLSFKNKEEIPEGFRLPPRFYGNLHLPISWAHSALLPEVVSGNLSLGSLKSAKGLKLPVEIGGNLDLHSLGSTTGLMLPRKINGDLNLSAVERVENLVLPEFVGGTLWLTKLATAKNLVFPKEVKGSVLLFNLATTDGLRLPEIVGERLQIGSLESPEGLVLPKILHGLSLQSLKSAKGLHFPEILNGDLILQSVESLDGVELPQTIGGDLRLPRLKTLVGFKLPKNIKGSINLPPGLDNEKN